MTSRERSYLIDSRPHDYGLLVRRWKAAVSGAGLRMHQIAKQAGFAVYGIQSRVQDSRQPALYLSAGCHGDEPAGALGLLEWVEANGKRIAKQNVVILPCLNPWGFSNNVRTDAEGHDLNRQFHSSTHPIIQGWRSFVKDRELKLVVTLHEDYDANGIYAYELNSRSGHSYAEPLLSRCERRIPREWRKTIEGRRAKRAIVRRTRGVPVVEEGMPEAVILFASENCATLTFETPSEFSLFDRVWAHREFVEGVFQMTASGR